MNKNFGYMRYQGGKVRQSKIIYNHIASLLEFGDFDSYVEPFVGGGSVLSRVSANFADDILIVANDIDKDLITMYDGLLKGWSPPKTLDKETYYDLKENRLNEAESYYVKGFAKFGCSYGGKAWGGFVSKEGNKSRDYSNEAYKSLMRLKATLSPLKEVNDKIVGNMFTCLDYKSLVAYYEDEIFTNSVIYLDPPYKGTTSYGGREFDHKEFYDIIKNLSKKGNAVLVTEFYLPFGTVLHEFNRYSTISGKNTAKRDVEKLYVI